MKYTNKWIVVPFNSIKQPTSKNEINKIFNDNTLSNDEKLSSYNNFKVREIRKNEIEEKKDNQNKDNQNFENEPKDIEQILESIPDEEIKNQNKKKKKIKKTLKDKSFYNVPPAKNTRKIRRIGNETLNQAFNSSVHKRKSKKKQKESDEVANYNQDDQEQINEKTPNNQRTLPSISPINQNESNYETPKAPIKQIKRLILKPSTLNVQKDPIVNWVDINSYRKTDSEKQMEID